VVDVEGLRNCIRHGGEFATGWHRGPGAAPHRSGGGPGRRPIGVGGACADRATGLSRVARVGVASRTRPRWVLARRSTARSCRRQGASGVRFCRTWHGGYHPAVTGNVDGEVSVPTAGDEARFWNLIESAWTALGPQPASLRQAQVDRDPRSDEVDVYALDAWLDPFLDRLRELCSDLSREDLVDLDRVLERKLYDIDREDIHTVADGSDDGFLYCRGYIVALGRAFYEAVSADPAVAVPDAECEAMCYFYAHLHHERFGEWPQTGSGISRESTTNTSGWPS